MVMGGDLRSRGSGFESQHCILNGHFSHYIVVKICKICLITPKIEQKETHF